MPSVRSCRFFHSRLGLFALAAACLIASSGRGDDPKKPPEAPLPSDDLTFRPTVLVMHGNHVGSGTVIASVPGETLVLTASHVVQGEGKTSIEVHRYNLGYEKTHGPEGWPKKISARVVARDSAADVALIVVGGFEAMPYVARVAFLLTEKPPDFGRSGGGLFRSDGTITGVCVGRAEVIKGRRVGVFSTSGNIRKIIHQNHFEKLIADSTARRTPKSQPADLARTPAAPAPRPKPPTPAPTRGP